MTLAFGAAIFGVGVWGLLMRRDADGLLVSCEVCLAGALVIAAGASRPALAVVAVAAAVAHVAILRRLGRAETADDESGDDVEALRW